MKTIYINCSFSIEDFKCATKLESNKLINVIDLTGALKTKNNIEILIPRLWDVDNSIELDGHKQLSQVVGKLGDIFGRYKVMSYPVYWTSAFAVKHPVRSVIVILYYLKNLLKKDDRLISLLKEKKVKVILPKNSQSYSELIQSWFERSGMDRPLVFSQKHKYSSIRIIISKLKSFLVSYVKILTSYNIPHSNSFKNINESIFITKTRNPTKDKDLGSILEVNKNLSSVYFPRSLQNYNFDVNTRFHNPIDDIFISAIPSFLDVIQIFLSSILESFKLLFLKNTFKDDNGYLFTILKQQIAFNIFDIESAFRHKWYTRFFSLFEKRHKFIYTDEFYGDGRIISSAKNESNNLLLTTIGFQHGLISSHHTVYKIGDAEIKSIYPLPIPDIFCVWGKLFKKQFLDFNSLQSNYVTIATHPKYKKIHKLNNKSHLSHREMGNLNVLWCTTLLEPAMFEFEILRKSTQINFENIVLREHPIHPIFKELINHYDDFSKWNDLKRDNENSIFMSLRSADLLICTNPSTVFIDALIHEVPIIFIDSGKVIPTDKIIKSNLIQNVRNVGEFDAAIKNIYNINFSQLQGASNLIDDLTLIEFLQSEC